MNVSSASEMDGEKVTSPEGQHGESGASDEEDEGAGEGSVAKKKEGEKKKEKQTLLDSVVFNIRLSLPGVPKLVDCVVGSIPGHMTSCDLIKCDMVADDIA